MAYKDPIHYYFIVPIVLLVVQVVGVILIYKVKSVILKMLEDFERRDNSDYRIVTRKEAEMRAKANEQERIVDNHKTLTMQGKQHNDEH